LFSSSGSSSSSSSSAIAITTSTIGRSIVATCDISAGALCPALLVLFT
jgi:hypothetical protein